MRSGQVGVSFSLVRYWESEKVGIVGEVIEEDVSLTKFSFLSSPKFSA